MHYAPRTIAFLAELFHPPVEPDPGAVQKIHNQLFQEPDPAYNSFAVTPAGSVLSNPVTRPGAVSSAGFLADRIQYREELTSLTMEEFAARVRDISALVSGSLGIQVYTAQQVTIRTLINPRHFQDSREYLKAGMFGFDDETEDFGREPQLYGIRMVFPPTPDQPSAFALRIESFNSDPRSLFIENQATFAPILVARGLEPLAENVEATYHFLVERCLSFVGRFDARLEA
jgi:hypothetical protein